MCFFIGLKTAVKNINGKTFFGQCVYSLQGVVFSVSNRWIIEASFEIKSMYVSSLHR